MSRSAGEATGVTERVEKMIGVALYEEIAEFPVERGYIWTTCSSVENGNPLFWDESVADALTGGPIAPPTMLSAWFRPHHWAPGRSAQRLPLQVHFDLKELLGLPEAVMTDNTMTFYEPVRVGDLLRTRQLLRSVSDEKVTKLGVGRFWVIDVEYENQRSERVGVESYTGFGYRKAEGESKLGSQVVGESRATGPTRARGASGASGASGAGAKRSDTGLSPEATNTTRRIDEQRPHRTIVPSLILAEVVKGDRLPTLAYRVTATTVVLGAMASRDWRPMHHDKDFAVNRNGTKDIFLNTPTQAAWFERFVTDWTGPHGRLGTMSFRMLGSVFPGDEMCLDAVVEDVGVDERGCGWVGLDITMSVRGHLRTTCDARVAVPVTEADNPWDRDAEHWTPLVTLEQP